LEASSLRRTAGDLLTPFGVFCLLDQDPSHDAFLFEGALGRYSYVGTGEGRLRLGLQPLNGLRAALAEDAYQRDESLPPFCGGYVGFLGWPAAGWTERLPQRLGPDAFFPDADLLRVREHVAFDHRQGRTWAIAHGPGAAERAQALASRVCKGSHRAIFPGALRTPAAQSLGARLFGDQRNGSKLLKGGLPEPVPVGGGEKQFKAAVRRALEYIRAGDVFQVVLSQRFELPDCDGFSLYRTLRAASPAPYHFYLRLGGRELFGASPELLVEVAGGKMTLRPIAGTRRRGASPEEDLQLEAELRADPKERAEHTMLVDLGRNDVGRVSRIGSVRVERLMETERFSHVMHMTSEVSGLLKPGLGAVDAFAAAFPAGTLSGAPKIARWKSSTSWKACSAVRTAARSAGSPARATCSSPSPSARCSARAGGSSRRQARASWRTATLRPNGAKCWRKCALRSGRHTARWRGGRRERSACQDSSRRALGRCAAPGGVAPPRRGRPRLRRRSLRGLRLRRRPRSGVLTCAPGPSSSTTTTRSPSTWCSGWASWALPWT